MDRGDRPRLPHLRDALGFDPEESFLRTGKARSYVAPLNYTPSVVNFCG